MFNSSKVYLTRISKGEIRVVWRELGENSIGHKGVKGPRQKVAKEPVAKVAPAAGKFRRVGRSEEAMPTAERLEEVGEPGEQEE